MYPFIQFAVEAAKDRRNEMRDAVEQERLYAQCKVARPSRIDQFYTSSGDRLIALGQWLKRRNPFADEGARYDAFVPGESR